MYPPASARPAGRVASLIVVNPSGNRTRVPVEPVPFLIGRQADNHLVIRDNRASRSHARIVVEGGEHYLEDLKSSHGVYVNGAKVQRQKLYHSDRIEFGFPDSYTLIFTLEEDEIHRILDQMPAPKASAGAGNLAKLRALVDVARALQNSLSTHDVLGAVVDAALAFTGFERGFLLLERDGEMEISVARNREGTAIAKSDLTVPIHTIQRALRTRRELLSMNFDPHLASPDSSAAGLDLRSVACVPLVHVRSSSPEETHMLTSKSDTIGVLYLDSRQTAVDLTAGNRELLQTLALEASTILENARLLEEERAKQRIEEELNIAREIQMSLLPRKLPCEGWFRAAGSSVPSHQVGGDYFDVRQIRPDCWSVVVTDVSGKGVSSAILAALLQGAFLPYAGDTQEIHRLMSRINHFLLERTAGEKYATVFFCTVDREGTLRWANAGHCTPFLLRRNGEMTPLKTTGMPLGMLEIADYAVERLALAPGDKIVAYSDGLSEAQNIEGKYFEPKLKELLRARRESDCAALHAALISAFEAHSEGCLQTDDITVVVLEYQP